MTRTRKRKSREALLDAYDREMLASAFVSLFWNIIAFKKEHGGFSLKSLSDKIGVNKSAPSRWFSLKRPNWTVGTIADIAGALGVDIAIHARDRATGTLFAPHGDLPSQVKTEFKIFEGAPKRQNPPPGFGYTNG